MRSATPLPPDSPNPAYPPAPWRLRGWAFQTLHLVDLAAVRPFLPPGLRIVPVGPRRTLGCVYVASYGSGSVLEYHELIVSPALAWREGRLGFWIFHIYVDDPASAAGGRDLWNLPKELAQFALDERSHQRRVVVRQGGRPLATVEHRPARAGLSMTLPLLAFGALDGRPRFFTGRARSRLGPAAVRVEIHRESPFAGLGIGRPLVGLHYAGLDLLADAPKPTGVPRTVR